MYKVRIERITEYSFYNSSILADYWCFHIDTENGENIDTMRGYDNFEECREAANIELKRYKKGLK